MVSSDGSIGNDLVKTREEIKKEKEEQRKLSTEAREKRKLEGRLLEYWYSFNNDSSYPAKEPNRIELRKQQGNLLIYDKIVFVKDKADRVTEVCYGGGAIYISELEKREREVNKHLDNFERDSKL